MDPRQDEPGGDPAAEDRPGERRGRRAGGARERVLDAYLDLLIADGERAATLGAVASRAGVSKGGLLYHFGSKEALAEGLLQRARDLAGEDVRAMRAAPEGPARYYVRTSVFGDTSMDRALMGVVRLAADAHEGAREVLRRTRQDWWDVLVEQVGDRARAHAILLIGDGLYSQASSAAEPQQALSAPELEELLGVVDGLARA